MIEPRFIVVEGGEGSGKSTVLDRLRKDPEFSRLVYTREPGGTEIGERIRAILKDPSLHPKVWTELFLFMAARSQLVEEVIRPKLASGQIVISDRYIYSTYAYQWFAGRGEKPPVDLMQLAEKAGMPTPGLLLWLDIDPTVGLTRRQQTEVIDRIDAQELAFHQRVREGFTFLFTTFDPFVHTAKRIDAAQSPEKVYTEVVSILRKHLENIKDQ